MKVQLQANALRLRIDEAELAQLLATGVVQAETRLAADTFLCQAIELVDAGEAHFSATAREWRLRLPRERLLAYAATLPRRDGLDLTQAVDEGVSLVVTLEVDVRDSVRARGPAPARGAGRR